MGRRKAHDEPVRKHVRRPKTPEEQEDLMISLAMGLAERQLQDGSASSQVISHFLKLGTEKERLEREKIARENKVLQMKAEAYESAKKIEELYSEALSAMRTYSGNTGDYND